jgi:hypothetical protein
MERLDKSIEEERVMYDDVRKVIRAAHSVGRELQQLEAVQKLVIKLEQRLQESERVTLALAKALKIAAENRPPRTAEEAMRKVHASRW